MYKNLSLGLSQHGLGLCAAKPCALSPVVPGSRLEARAAKEPAHFGQLAPLHLRGAYPKACQHVRVQGLGLGLRVKTQGSYRVLSGGWSTASSTRSLRAQIDLAHGTVPKENTHVLM